MKCFENDLYLVYTEINYFVCGVFLVNYMLILVDFYVELFGKIEEVNMVGYF